MKQSPYKYRVSQVDGKFYIERTGVNDSWKYSAKSYRYLVRWDGNWRWKELPNWTIQMGYNFPENEVCMCAWKTRREKRVKKVLAKMVDSDLGGKKKTIVHFPVDVI